MTDLATRIASATEGSRDLDAEIHEYLGKQDRPPSCRIHADLPYYTTNLQHALAVVPEGYGYVLSDADWSTARASIGWKNTTIDFDAPKFDVCAATPALALCSAALKAHKQ